MASSSSGVDDARLAAEALTIRTLTQQYGFGIETAQNAVKQLGDPSDLELAVTWCLDVGGEEDNGGAVALRHCPYVKDAPIVDASAIVIGKPCADCGAVGENWICLITGATRCSRYVNKCSLKHYEANPEHFLALSLSDLSVWSYKSEHYVSNAEVQPHAEVARAQKFGSSSSAAAPAPAPLGAISEEGDEAAPQVSGGKRRASSPPPSPPPPSPPEPPPPTSTVITDLTPAAIHELVASIASPSATKRIARLPAAVAAAAAKTLSAAADANLWGDPTNIDRLADEFANAGLAASDWVPAAAYRGLGADDADGASDSMPAAEFRGLAATDSDGDADVDVVGNAEWLEVRSKKDLAKLVLKGRDGSLEYVLPGGERFTFAGRSRDAEQKTLGGWLRFAVNDLRYNAQTRSAEAKAAVAAQVEELEARLSVDGPFAVRASDPNAAPRGPPWMATPPALLQSGPSGPPPPMTMDDVAARLRGAKKIVVMCGAGISVSAGIPDFRTPGTGLYDNLQAYGLPFAEAIFDIGFFEHNPKPFYHLAKTMWPGQYEPTPTHRFLKLLDDRGVLLRCFTQNIDSLEAAAGLPPAQIVAAHGNFDGAHVAHRFDGGGDGGPVDVDALRDAIMAGEDGPGGWRAFNKAHGGLAKPSITFFGEALPKRLGERAGIDLPEADFLIVMGTSLKVQPFASLVDFVEPKVPRLLINREAVGDSFRFGEPGSRDVFLQGDCDDGVRRLVEMLGWEARL